MLLNVRNRKNDLALSGLSVLVVLLFCRLHEIFDIVGGKPPMTASGRNFIGGFLNG